MIYIAVFNHSLVSLITDNIHNNNECVQEKTSTAEKHLTADYAE